MDWQECKDKRFVKEVGILNAFIDFRSNVTGKNLKVIYGERNLNLIRNIKIFGIKLIDSE